MLILKKMKREVLKKVKWWTLLYLDNNPLVVGEMETKDIQVFETVKDGESI